MHNSIAASSPDDSGRPTPGTVLYGIVEHDFFAKILCLDQPGSSSRIAGVRLQVDVRHLELMSGRRVRVPLKFRRRYRLRFLRLLPQLDGTSDSFKELLSLAEQQIVQLLDLVDGLQVP